jgi:F0F1-type ATP synthase assembly protein I
VSKRPGIGSDFAKGSAEAARGLGYAFGFVGITMAFFGLGWLVDNWLGTEPVFQVIGSVVGFVLGFVAVYYGSKQEGNS